MSTPENPWDTTIWDPINPEQAIEDPLHGPSALGGLLETPPMPLGDSRGLYYQPGGFYIAGTIYVDAKDLPVYMIGSARSMQASMREMNDLEEWREASCLGEDALTALEAQRQRARLDRTGVAYAFRPSDVCGGGIRLDECETAGVMVPAAQEIAANADRPTGSGEGRMWNVPARLLGRTCTSCSLACEVAYETVDGKPTGITRFATARPLLDDFAVIRIDLTNQ